jgi:hypothetical protein
MSNHDMWYNDFFFIWAFAKFVISHPASQLFDASILRSFQMDLGAAPRATAPYSYPPSFLPFILPLGLMPFYVAYGLWVAASFGVYVIASLYKNGWRHYRTLVIILAPTTVAGIVTGQTGLLVSALIVSGFKFIEDRPVLAGILFGLASFKPQFGLLIPIALLAARQWQTLISASLVVLAFALLSSAAFGWSIWPLWLSRLPAHVEWVAGIESRFQPTILANLTSLGAGRFVAWTIQAGAAALVAIAIWFCFSRGVTISAVAALLTGTILATPYAFHYDLPMTTNAVLAVRSQRDALPSLRTFIETTTGVLVLLLTIIMISYRLSIIRIVPLIILFVLIVWRILTPR